MTYWAYFAVANYAHIGHINLMRLIDHLKASAKTVAEFANEIGEAESTVRKIVYGQRQPSLPLAVKITEATNGAVTAADMLLTATSADRPEAA